MLEEKICKNLEQVQNELLQEAWNKVKPEIKERLDKVSKALEAGDLTASMNEVPEKYLKYQSDLSCKYTCIREKRSIKITDNTVNI